MKTTDRVMKEKFEKSLKELNTHGWNIPHGTIADEFEDILSHSLAEARREWVEEMRGKVNDMKYRGIAHSDLEARRHNALLEKIEDLLTGDNPERKEK